MTVPPQFGILSPPGRDRGVHGSRARVVHHHHLAIAHYCHLFWLFSINTFILDILIDIVILLGLLYLLHVKMAEFLLCIYFMYIYFIINLQDLLHIMFRLEVIIIVGLPLPGVDATQPFILH